MTQRTTVILVILGGIALGLIGFLASSGNTTKTQVPGGVSETTNNGVPNVGTPNANTPGTNRPSTGVPGAKAPVVNYTRPRPD